MTGKLHNSIVSIFLVMLFVGLAACNPANIKRNSNLEDTLLHYKIMMNRSNYPAAARFRAPTAAWNIKGYEKFQLSHYEVKQSENVDKNTLKRTVFLRYLNRYTMRERSLMYTEKWVYNQKAKQWLLDGKPPVFR